MQGEAMKRVSILGDSISTFEGCVPEGFRVYYEGARRRATGVKLPSDTWWAQVVSGMGGVPWRVGAYSGSLVEGAGFPAGESAERVAALARDGVAPDEVLVFMGVNDYGWGGAAAQAAGRGNAVPACLDLADVEPQMPGLADADAAERFGAAYERMLARVRRAYPQTTVRCCTLCRLRPLHVRLQFARRAHRVLQRRHPGRRCAHGVRGRRRRGARVRLRGRGRHAPHGARHAPARRARSARDGLGRRCGSGRDGRAALPALVRGPLRWLRARRLHRRRMVVRVPSVGRDASRASQDARCYELGCAAG